MKTIELSYPHQLTQLPQTVAAIGFFDGIHKGHQKVIQTAVKRSLEMNVESAVITFHPHPSVILNETVQHVQYITSLDEKKRILKQLHVDRLYIIEFNKSLSLLSPQEFINHFIINLNIKHLVAGFDYSYGHKGAGNMTNIKDHTRDFFTYTVIDKVELDEEKISSSKIRKLLRNGDVEAINGLLGRALSVEGVVIEGDKRGRTIGYPTANLQIDSSVLLPRSGVYAVKVLYEDKEYEGMANLGVRPTFIQVPKAPSLEVNIFDYNNNIYGKKIKIEWHQFIREEHKFNSVESLVNQIRMDEATIRRFFQNK